MIEEEEGLGSLQRMEEECSGSSQTIEEEEEGLGSLQRMEEAEEKGWGSS